MAGDFWLPDFVKCPHCGASLEKESGVLFCRGQRRHTYDIAKEGYVNLLPPGRARNARTGDEAEMMRARVKFLSGGGYDRYSREAAFFAAEYLQGKAERLVLIDAGCGEGRHTVNMASALYDKTGIPVVCVGFDASKYGAAAAAKRYVRRESVLGVTPFFAAAGIFDLPVSDCSADLFCSLFAPLPGEEAARVLKPGGVLLICAAGARHLFELREILYDNPILSGGGAAVPAGFKKAGEFCSEYRLELVSHEEIMSLFTMTPFFYNAPASGRERLALKESLTITVQVKCTAAVKIG